MSVQRNQSKPRLDELLVERGLYPDLHAAAAAVLAGEVVVGDHRETSAGKRVARDVELRVKASKKTREFVSRGGKKLAGALDAFSFDATGLSCADLGASSGGFTDCLLKAGAAHVSAVDVNYGQFDWSLRNDARVTLFERTNVHGIDVGAVGGPFDLVVGDLSFISLRTVMPDICALLKPGASLITLVKPQFEAPRELVGEGGVVHDPKVHELAVARVVAAAREQGLGVRGLAVSPIKGPAGNIEFLLWATRPAQGEQPADVVDSSSISDIVSTAHSTLNAS